MQNHLISVVRELFGFYKSTTQSVIFLPREKGGLGIKNVAMVYYTTRISYLIKMLNHEVDKFKNVARESFKLDMKKTLHN